MLELIVIWANNRGAIRSLYKMGRTLVCLVFFFFSLLEMRKMISVANIVYWN